MRPARGGREPWLAVALVAATLAVYAPVARHAFVNFDDPEYVTENPHVRRGLTLDGVEWAFTRAWSANWHPVTWLSHMLDCELFGLSPGAHHLTNVVLHAASAILLLVVLARITGAPGASAVVAFLFALHPMQVESVAWVSERKDVLSGLFFVLVLAAYAAYVRSPGAGRYALVLATFAVGLMAKPMLVTLPFVLLLLDWWPLGRRDGFARLVREKLPLVALAAATSVVALATQRQAGAMASLATLPIPVRVANAFLSYAAYVGKLLWPAGLAVFYPPRTAFPLWRVAAAAVLLGGGTGVAFVLRRRAPYVLVGWLWYVGMLVPVIGLVKVGEQAMADRFTYLPSIGLFLVAAWGLGTLLERRPRARAALAAGAIAVSAALTWRQVGFWRDSASLFDHALAVTEGNYVAHNNRGIALLAAGRTEEAVEHWNETLRIQPANAKAHLNLGVVLAARGERDAARAHYAAALRAAPGDASAHYNSGLLLAQEGRLDEAIAEYREALRIAPEYAKAHTNLGWALAATGDRETALDEYREALRIDPELAVAHNNLAVALDDLGRADEALVHYGEAARLLPREPQARFNLASALAEHGRAAEAIPHYEEVLRLRPEAPEVHVALAAAYAKAGRFSEAATAAEKAYGLARAAGQEELAATARARVSAYREARRAP